MIFIANILELNGGTTFLVRTCAALRAAGRPCAVLVLRPGGDAKLADELARHARIFHLGTFQRDQARLFRRHLGALAPLVWSRLAESLAPFGPTLHAMGAFGLIVGARLAKHAPAFRVTVGVYHQNEFLYRQHPLFSADLMRLFRRVPPENVLFFNEVSRDNYIRYHAEPAYGRSPIAPIGISIPARPPAAHRPGRQRIASVGNLERFKTYNTHIIDLLPGLAADFSDVSYQVYGGGERLDALRAQARRLGVEHRVTFHGQIAYDRLPEVWDDTDVFVGSGTALIEAAAAGLPALVGVESIPTPLTYGFLSDIEGLSYNELGANLPLRSMDACIRHVLGDAGRWRTVADACVAKARNFSVERTAQGMATLAAGAAATPDLISAATTLRMLAGLPALALRDRLSPDTAFALRRNQSFEAPATCSR